LRRLPAAEAGNHLDLHPTARWSENSKEETFSRPPVISYKWKKILYEGFLTCKLPSVFTASLGITV
jgi:hypothetical protein